MQCFYVDGYRYIIDLVEDGKTKINKESLESVKLRHPKAELWDFDRACDRIAEITAKEVVSEPIEIDEDRFDEMLGAMPPMKWQSREGSESFMLCEAFTMHYHSIFCRIGDRYFEFTDSKYLTHDQITEKVYRAIATCKALANGKAGHQYTEFLG